MFQLHFIKAISFNLNLEIIVLRTNSTLYVLTESLKLLTPYLGPDVIRAGLYRCVTNWRQAHKTWPIILYTKLYPVWLWTKIPNALSEPRWFSSGEEKDRHGFGLDITDQVFLSPSPDGLSLWNTKKMLSMGFQSGVNNAFTCYSLLCQTPSCKTFKATIPINPKPNQIRSSTFFDRNRRHVSRNQRYTAFAVPEAPAAETPADAPPSNAAEESITIRETEVHILLFL